MSYPRSTDSTRWELKLADFYVGNTSIYDSASPNVALDTFFRPILVPNSTFTAFASYLNESIGSNVTCNTTGGYCYFLERCDK